MDSFNDLPKYLGKYNDKEYKSSNANGVCNQLRLRTPWYYQILMLGEELEEKRTDLTGLSEEEFDKMYKSYYDRHESLEGLGLTNAIYPAQREEIYLAGHPFSILLEEIRARYFNFPDYEVKVHSVRIIDKDRGHYVDSSGLDLQIGNTVNLGGYIQPTTAENKAITWESSNPEIVSIDKDGTIIANARGSSIITASTVDGEKKSSCKIIVEDNYRNYNNWKYSPTGVELEKNWRIRLSKPLEAGSVNKDSVYILDKNENKLDYIIATVEEDEIGQYILLLNTKGFVEGESYTLVITPKVKSQSGDYLKAGIKMKW